MGGAARQSQSHLSRGGGQGGEHKDCMNIVKTNLTQTLLKYLSKAWGQFSPRISSHQKEGLCSFSFSSHPSFVDDAVNAEDQSIWIVSQSPSIRTSDGKDQILT